MKNFRQLINKKKKMYVKKIYSVNKKIKTI